MSEPLLQIQDLSAAIEDGELLHQISLEIGSGETHVLMGPNGAGKSTLGHTIMGNPQYRVTGGTIRFDGEDITEMPVDERSRKGIFLRSALRTRTGRPVRIFQFKKELESVMELLQMDPSYADRDLNAGFSGGEKKKAEILQLLMLSPRLAILDETDSGLDVDAVRTVSAGIREYQKRTGGALLIITHNAAILNALQVDHTHVLVRGRIVADGDGSLIDEIHRDGFEKYIEMSRDMLEEK